MGLLQVFKMVTFWPIWRTCRSGQVHHHDSSTYEGLCEKKCLLEVLAAIFKKKQLVQMILFSCCMHRPCRLMKFTEKTKFQILMFHINVHFLIGSTFIRHLESVRCREFNVEFVTQSNRTLFILAEQ
jgi:hypothetical protein